MKVSEDPESIQNYVTDEAGAYRAAPGSIQAVYFPETEQDVIEILKEVNQTRIPVTISGGGTSITGARVPISGGIVISTERMLHARPVAGMNEVTYKGLAGDIVFYLDETGLVARVPPGMLLRELDGALPRGVFYPPDPTETAASIGGTVATNASGARSFMYGPTRNWITGLRAVLASGDIIDIRRGETHVDSSGHLTLFTESGKDIELAVPDLPWPAVKNAAGVMAKHGMDAIDLFIGSEGIFGVYSEITLKLESKPQNPALDLAFFDRTEQALGYVDRIRELKDGAIMSIEYFDSNSLELARNEYPMIREDVRAAVFTEIGKPEMDVMNELATAQAGFGAVEDWCAVTSSDIRDLKEFRHSLPDGVNTYLKQHQSYKLGTDFAVPVDKFRAMMKAYSEVGEEFRKRFPRDGLHYTIFGHIGQHHVHFNFITHTAEEQAYAKQLYVKLARKAVELGGTISAEHGVGKKRVEVGGREMPYLELMYGPEHLKKVTELKRQFDQNLILNPGNIVPLIFR